MSSDNKYKGPTYGLSLDQDLALGRRVRSGDSSAVDELLAAYEGLVAQMARSYGPYDGSERDTLKQEARIALWDATKAYDPEQGRPFGPFARQRIDWVMMDYLTRKGQESDLKILERRTQYKIIETRDSLMREGKPGTPEEVYVIMKPSLDENYSVDDVRRLLEHAEQGPLLQSLTWEEDGEGTIVRDIPMSDRGLRGAAAGLGLDQLLGVLDDRGRIILELFYDAQSPTLDDIGKKILPKVIPGHEPISRERVRQLKNKALGDIREAFDIPEPSEK
ncbi:MAG: helix-turn-helix domain-containing protein [Candidatus Aenigmarchaeota archaeon]|nr:helix-turn-helix domain-containing protein [Candidatus Aenigmarchaeota archaeon]